MCVCVGVCVGVWVGCERPADVLVCWCGAEPQGGAAALRGALGRGAPSGGPARRRPCGQPPPRAATHRHRCCLVQAEEERHLQQALRQYATSHGPTTVRQHAQELWQQQHTRKPAAGAQLGKQQPIAKQALVRRQAKEPWKQPKQASKAAATGNGTAAPAAAATAGAAS